MVPALQLQILAAQQGGTQSLFLLVIIFGIFWFLMIAPMRKKEKKLQQMRQELKNGDKVITQGGVLGTVVGVDETTCRLRVAENVKISVLKSAVAGFQAEDSVS